MAKVNDLKAVCVLDSDGNYGGRMVYSFKTALDANTYYVLAFNKAQATKMSTAIALSKTEAISTAVALLPIYVQSGFSI